MNAKANAKGMLRLTASVLVVGSGLMLGSVSGQAAGSSPKSAEQSVRSAAVFASKAAKALVRKKTAKAVTWAETAVALQPRVADYRMVLGQAYLAAGRFDSAAQSFADTLSLDPERDRAALNLALAQVAQGKGEAARATLADYRDKLPAADFGLALALAGDADEAVRILEFATRAPDATAKTRQNLALAYALAGKWQNAKVMAVQDITPDEADTRLAQWALLARPGSGQAQVASLLGVKPAFDAGQPTRLALATPAAPTAVAAATPVAPAPVVEAVAAAPEPVAVAVVDQPAFETPVVSAPAPAPVVPVIRAEPRPVREAALPPSQVTAPRPPVAKPAVVAVPRPARLMKASFQPPKGGKFVVQLGAFQNVTAAERAWNRVSGRVGLTGYDAVNGAARVRNATLVRVAVGSFATRADADRMCARIKQSGNVCFVRTQAGDAPARWVQKQTFKVASR